MSDKPFDSWRSDLNKQISNENGQPPFDVTVKLPEPNPFDATPVGFHATCVEYNSDTDEIEVNFDPGDPITLPHAVELEFALLGIEFLGEVVEAGVGEDGATMSIKPNGPLPAHGRIE